MKTIRWYAFSVVVFIALAGCGSAETGAPEGSRITFNPDGYAWHNADPTAACYDAYPRRFQVVLTTASGVPMNDVEIILSAAGGMTLVNDSNNNGELDVDELAVPVREIRTKTHAFGAKYFFISVRLGGGTAAGCSGLPDKGLEYETHVAAFSGGNYNNSIHTITSVKPPAPAP